MPTRKIDSCGWPPAGGLLDGVFKGADAVVEVIVEVGALLLAGGGRSGLAGLLLGFKRLRLGAVPSTLREPSVDDSLISFWK